MDNKKYRLKKEAATFFNEFYSLQRFPLSAWDAMGVNVNALEEDDEPSYSISFMHSSWKENRDVQFNFNLDVSNCSHEMYEEIKKNLSQIIAAMENGIDNYFGIDNYLNSIE
jgi:hypothetical protein